MKRICFVKNLDENILLLFKQLLVSSPKSMKYTKIEKLTIICSNWDFLTKSIR